MTTEIQGDRALTGDGVDRLGFRPMAERLAEALATGAATEGLVVGVLGRWGSGKSSLLNLTQAATERRGVSSRPHVVEFKPWLVGDRHALLQALFAELIAGIDQIEYEAGDATGVSLRRIQHAGEAVRDFADKLGDIGKIVKGSGIPGPSDLGGVWEWLRGRPAKDAQSLARSKASVCERLRKLKRSLVVIIDDVDRLDPSEIVEVLRLVRSVADFPNVTYVLSYDQEVVSHAVEVAARAEDGDAYVEKIVQITLSVPVPEAFELRRWFESELLEMGVARTAEQDRRVADVIDGEGGRYLNSPRAVIRTLDAARFHWSAVRDQVDFSDFLWLQFVRVGNPALFNWIAGYLTEISARSIGRTMISAEDVARSRARLDAALECEAETLDRRHDRLAEFLPGINSPTRQGADGSGLFQQVSRAQIDRAIRDRRLASPDHYRIFVAFTQPTNAPTLGDFEALRSALDESPVAAAGLLVQWQGQRLTSGVSKAEIILDRLSAQDRTDFDAGQAECLLMVFADAMDELGAGSVADFDGPDIWRRAKRMIPALLATVAAERRPDTLRAMFGTGRALGWLTSVFRNDTFAHGRFGSRPSSDQLLSKEALDLVWEVLRERYRAMSFADFGALPETLSALYGWQQGGDEEEPRTLLRDAMSTDEGLVDVLERLGTTSYTSSTSEGADEVVSLSRNNLQSLIDYDGVRERLVRLAAGAVDPNLRVRTQLLIRWFESADRF